MSETDSGFPSRREIRTGNTGAIVLPDQPPLTRRERKLREHLAETGALPPQAQVAAPPVIDEPAPSIAPPAATIPEPPRPPAPPAQPAAPSSGAPLTRRQLREQLRSPATDALAAPPPRPATAASGESASPLVDTSPIVEPPGAPKEHSTTAGATPVPEQVVPLPPVFAPPSVSTDDSLLAQSRSVGPAAPATNALILPVAPPMDMTGPLGDTGEVLITGNIPLPKHVVETGITGVIDVDVDDEDDFIDADSGVYTQPIRAVQAVSSRSLELEAPMIKRPRWGAVSLALGISAAVLGVTAVSLLALALLTDIVQLPL